MAYTVGGGITRVNLCEFVRTQDYLKPGRRLLIDEVLYSVQERR